VREMAQRGSLRDASLAFRLGMVAVVSGAIAGAAVASDEGPWRVGAPEWVFVQEEAIDSWPGIYHDSESGACIHFDVAFPFVVCPLPAPDAKDADIEVGRSGVVPYRLKVSSTAAEVRKMRADMKRLGVSDAALPSSNGCPGGRRISVAFMPEGLAQTSQVWNAHADTCSDAQFQRVREFFFGTGRGPATDRRPARDGRLLDKTEVEAVAVGTPYEEVRAKLGAPSWGECGPGDGFTAEWTYKARPHWIERKFRFGRDHRLVAKR